MCEVCSLSDESLLHSIVLRLLHDCYEIACLANVSDEGPLERWTDLGVTVLGVH